MNTIALRFDDLSFRVVSPVASHLQWVEEFFLPHFNSDSGNNPSVEVRLKIDPQYFARLRSLPTKARETPAFLLDSDVVSLTTIENPCCAVTLLDEQFRAFYQVSEDRALCTIIIGEDNIRTRTALMRVIREYVTNHCHARGDIFLHASSFIRERRAIVITGPKNAGKTTLLLFACMHGGGSYLANDRVLIQFREGESAVRGMPAIVNVRKTTTGFFPEVRKKIQSRGLHFRLHSQEHRDNIHPRLPLGQDKRYTLSPRQFCSIAGTTQVSEACNPVVVIPVISYKPGTFSVRRLLPEEAAVFLEDSLFGVRHWVTSTPIFNLRGTSGGPTKECILDKCQALIASQPFLLCEVGMDFYRHSENAVKWLDQLLDTVGEGYA